MAEQLAMKCVKKGLIPGVESLKTAKPSVFYLHSVDWHCEGGVTVEPVRRTVRVQNFATLG